VAAGDKAPGALLTISELSSELGVAQHILRYWETRFPQLKPMQRAGNRRYYRPDDVELARRINRLLNEEGYTVRGVQKVLKSGDATAEQPAPEAPPVPQQPPPATPPASPDVFRLIQIRNRLAAAIGD
jgi:DNA-binding transcriptional MerR regulator